MFHTISTVAREEGPRSLYNGLTPGLQRQLAFCAVRIGMYDTIKNMYLKKFKGGSINKKNKATNFIIIIVLSLMCTFMVRYDFL